MVNSWILVFFISILQISIVWTELVNDAEERETGSFLHLEHPFNYELFSEIKKCGNNASYCDENYKNITALCVKIANEHNQLLLVDRAKTIFEDIVYYMEPHTKIGQRALQILAALAFGQGNQKEAEKYWPLLDKNDLISQRTHAAQVIISGSEALGILLMLNYSTMLAERFVGTLTTPSPFGGLFNIDLSTPSKKNDNLLDDSDPKVVRSQSNDESEEFLYSLLLSEAQGGVRASVKLTDLSLSTSEIKSLDSKQRFRLGVGLAKLGLYDLSLQHVWLAATPWDPPLYRLRAQLLFPPVHGSMRSLASAVDSFERQSETILLSKNLFNSPVMVPVCNSLNEASLALQSLPLLHMSGYSSPRGGSSSSSLSAVSSLLVQAQVSLPVLLSEVYRHMCATSNITVQVQTQLKDSQLSVEEKLKREAAAAKTRPAKSRTFESKESEKKFKVGIVAGTMDGDIGRIMIGLMDGMSHDDRREFEFFAMCFPTPRNANTDKVNGLFDAHINLSSDNKTQAIQRIQELKLDFVLFADPALDVRVFAVAHERLALHQGILWGYGGSLGIPSIDYYFMPEVFWSRSKCPVTVKSHTTTSSSISSSSSGGSGDPNKAAKTSRGSGSTTTSKKRAGGSGGGASSSLMQQVPPQDLFQEQVILLEGLPNVPRPKEVSIVEVSSVLQNRYLLMLGNRTHLYIIPCTVKLLHPEFDSVIEVILKTDPTALILVAVPRMGRDNLPTNHIAIRHDLMHPSMSVATVQKFMLRLRVLIGNDDSMLERVRVLPPLDDHVYRALVRQAVAVLDPFPVGLHLPILEAVLDSVPVISAPALQECTNSHAYSLAGYCNITNSPTPVRNQQQQPSLDVYPASAEEYGVMAIRINRDERLRNAFIAQNRVEFARAITRSKSAHFSHGMQLLQFFRRLRDAQPAV